MSFYINESVLYHFLVKVCWIGLTLLKLPERLQVMKQKALRNLKSTKDIIYFF